MTTDSQSPLRRNNQLVAGAVLVLLVLSFAGVLLKMFVLPAPIYSGDEYAYYRLGVNITGLDTVTARDTAIQRLDNYGYLRIVQAASALSGSPFKLVGILQSCCWLFVLFAVWLTSNRVLARPYVLIPLLLVSLAPFSSYASALMPEIMLGACFWLASLAVLHFSTRNQWRHLALVLGVGIAPMLFVKIHAATFAVSAVVFFVLLPFIAESARVAGGALKNIAINLVFFIASFFVSYKCSALLLSPVNMPAADGSFYLGYVGQIKPELVVDVFRDTAKYLLLHLHILSLFFLPGLVGVVSGLWKAIRRQGAGGTAVALPTFWLIALVCHLGMTSFFTSLFALNNAFEADRFHERYYWYLVPVLVVLTIQAWDVLSATAQRVIAGFAFLNVLLFIFHTSVTFKIYPWDAADFFGLNQGILLWEFEQPYPGLTWVLYGLMAVLALAGIVLPVVRKQLWVLTMLALAGISFVGVLAWQYKTMQTAQPLYQQGRMLDAISGPAPLGVVGPDRFGPMVYFLAGLKIAPYVGAGDGLTIREQDVPADVGIAVFLGNTVYNGKYFRKLSTPVSTIYLLKPQPGMLNSFSFAADKMLGETSGFNAPEKWGSWTAAPTATIRLFHPVNGTVHLKLWGLVDAPTADEPVTLRLGNAEAAIKMSTTGQGYEAVLVNVDQADVLEISSGVYENSGRTLGVALRDLTLVEETR